MMLKYEFIEHLLHPYIIFNKDKIDNGENKFSIPLRNIIRKCHIFKSASTRLLN